MGYFAECNMGGTGVQSRCLNSGPEPEPEPETKEYAKMKAPGFHVMDCANEPTPFFSILFVATCNAPRS